MIIETIDLYKYHNIDRGSNKGGYLTCYIKDPLIETGASRCVPGMLIIPGGGYSLVSVRESEPIALAYLDKNFNTFVLKYSVYPSIYPTQLIEASMAMIYIRENSGYLHLNEKSICGVGFSAGGHLLGMIANLYNEQILLDLFKEKASLIKPDAIVLSYPVISSIFYPHTPSFNNLTNKDEDLSFKLSLETRVTKDSPAAFIWTTANDTVVPAVNSIEYAKACAINNVPYELHVFNKGFHGAATIDEKMFSIITEENFKKFSTYLKYWVDLSVAFLKDNNIVMELRPLK